jgi:hypothetical protein
MAIARTALALSIIAVALSGVAVMQGRPAAPPAELVKDAGPATQEGERAGYLPGLGEIMTAVQMRHAKLGIAGAASNWALADYELDELEEGLDDAVTYHPVHKTMKQPLTDLMPTFMKAPIDNMRAAVAAKDLTKFNTAFDALTTGCNDCHKSAEFGFNVVIRPTAAPMPNQDFLPAK